MKVLEPLLVTSGPHDNMIPPVLACGPTPEGPVYIWGVCSYDNGQRNISLSPPRSAFVGQILMPKCPPISQRLSACTLKHQQKGKLFFHSTGSRLQAPDAGSAQTQKWVHWMSWWAKSTSAQVLWNGQKHSPIIYPEPNPRAVQLARALRSLGYATPQGCTQE